MQQLAQASSALPNSEAERKTLQRQITDLEKEKLDLEKDHSDMTQMYECQTIELESLVKDNSELKTKYRKVLQDVSRIPSYLTVPNLIQRGF